ncbi:MAG: FIST C-terminal domain-containing protein [Proteobacteria bacterium]|jgi:hypothetical protein|nr:FIST C-terminal domain-containing protein [Pseudomonadota bacterium]
MCKQQVQICFLPQIEAIELENTLQQMQIHSPHLGVFAFLPEAQKNRLDIIQATCQKLSIPLIGAIPPALLKDNDFNTEGILLIGFEEMPYFSLLENLSTDPDEVQQKTDEIIANIHQQLGSSSDLTLFMVFDAVLPNIGTLLDNIYLQLANRVHYAGINVGSETFQPMPCLFDAEKIVSNGLLLILLQNNKGAILEHGYHAPKKVVYATSTENNCISQIDWRPAFKVYQELIMAQYGIEINRDNFYELAVHYPFGIVRANHHVVVRIPVMLADDDSLYCIGEVPANSVITLLERPSVDSGETLKVLHEGLTDMNGSTADKELLLFYCAGRRLHLGIDVAKEELKEFKSLTQATLVVGALSLGEIGSSTLHGYPLFQNATLVALQC